MPNYGDIFPQNYGVTHNPLDTLAVDPMQFINGVETPFGGSAANPIASPLQLAITCLDSLINFINWCIQYYLPGAPTLPTISVLIKMLESMLSPEGLLFNFINGVSFVSMLFGGLPGIGPGSGAGLFGQSALFQPGGLFGGVVSDVPFLGQLITAAGGVGSTLADFGNLFNGITTIAVTEITGLATGIENWLANAGLLPSSVTAGLSQITGLATGIGSWLGVGGALPTATTLGVNALTGLATGVLTWLASGGALPSGATAAVSQLTGLATGIGTWLGAGGALPSLTTLGAGALTGLATGVGTWLTSGGALPSSATAAVGQLTGLATGMGTWLSSAGALPAAVTMAGAQLTGSVASALLSGTIAAGIIPTITAGMTSGLAPIDTLMNQWGVSGTGHTVSELVTLLTNGIPGTAINGLFGANSIDAAVQDFLDSHVQGLTGINTLINQGTAQIQTLTQQAMQFLGWNYSNPSVPQSGSVAAQTNANNATLNNRAVQKPPYANIDPTTDAVFEMRDVWQNASPPLIAVTKGATTLGDITIRDGGTKQAITWYGFPTGGTMANISDFRIVLYSVDRTTNLRTEIYTTPNISASVATGTVPQFNSYNLAALNYVNANSGDQITAELAINGTGTYNLVGQTIASWLPFHPTYGLHGYSRIPSPYSTALGSGFTSNTTLTPVATTAPTLVSSAAGGSSTGANTPSPLTWTETIGTTANCTVVALEYFQTNTPTISVTCGGVAMTAGSVYSYGNNSSLQFFYLMNPPTGTQTISVSYSVAGGGSLYLNGSSMSFTGVGGVAGTVAGVTVTGTTITQTVTSNTGQTLVNMMGNGALSTGSFTAYSKTQIANHAGTVNHDGYVAGYGAGAASVTFSATIPSNTCGSLTLALDGVIQVGTLTHTATAGDTVVLTIAVNGPSGTTQANFRRSATYGGVAMTSLGVQSVSDGTNNFGWVEMFGLLNVSGGTNTVAFSVAGGKTGTATTFYNIEANTESYGNVASFGTAVTGGTGAGSSLTSGSISTAAPAMVIQAFWTVYNSGATTDSAYSGTSRWNQSQLNSTANWGSTLLVGDAVATGSLTFTATASSSANANAQIAIPLISAIFNTPTTFTPGSGTANPAASRIVPWIGLSGVAATTIYQPITKTFTSGTGQSFDPATFAPWANYVDILQWSDGAAGAAGSPANSGAGGGGGNQQHTTLSKSQFTSGAWTLDVGFGTTGAGSQNRVIVPGYGTLTIAGAGLQIASGSSAAGDNGAPSPAISYNDAHGAAQYFSGAGGGVAPGGGGGQPGGGGAGGAIFWYGSGTPGNGGPGMTILRFYQ